MEEQGLLRVLCRGKSESALLPPAQRYHALGTMPRYYALFSRIKDSMQLFMWQRDIVGVAHYIKDCFETLGALGDASEYASTSSSSALAAG